MRYESSTKKNVNTCRTNTVKFYLSPRTLTHFASVHARCKEATIVAISEIGILRNDRIIRIKYYAVYVER